MRIRINNGMDWRGLKSKNTTYLLVIAVVLFGLGFFAYLIHVNISHAEEAKPQYKLEERLPTTQSPSQQTPKTYKKLNWDELMPKD
jgi:hypothetical protein